MDPARKNRGIQAALASAIFLGIIPIFGKQAILFGFSPLAVVALRTSIASFLLLLIMLGFQRQYFYIYPVGLIGCILAGFINGLGSILYYIALSRLDASIGQLLYSFYPLFVAMWLLLDQQSINRLTALRLIISLPAAYLLIYKGQGTVDYVGVTLMVGSAILYALHLIINQRVLYEVPAPTVTFYTLISMSFTVIIAYFIFDRHLPAEETPWWPILGMAAVTFFSRLTLFLGVKHLGGLQTAMLGLGELLVTIGIAHLWLNETLSLFQWGGASLLILSLLLVIFDKYKPEKRRGKGWLSWLNPPSRRVSDFRW